MGYIRFLLAIEVMAFHLRIGGPLGAFSGQAAVEAFFVLSGFYMGLLFEDRFSLRDSGRFVASRYFRVAPAYLTSVLFSLALFAVLSANAATSAAVAGSQIFKYFALFGHSWDTVGAIWIRKLIAAEISGVLSFALCRMLRMKFRTI